MSELSHLSQRAAKLYRQGNRSRWAVALIASRIVGKYDRGETVALAKAVLCSVSTIESLAAAGIMYRTLRILSPEHIRALRILRRDVPYSHWAALWSAWRAYEFGPIQALRYLGEAKMLRLSVGDFRGGIDAHEAQAPLPAAEPLELDSERMVEMSNKSESAREAARVLAGTRVSYTGRVVERYGANPHGQSIVIHIDDDEAAPPIGSEVLVTVVPGRE